MCAHVCVCACTCVCTEKAPAWKPLGVSRRSRCEPVEGAGFDEILANARGAKGGAALARELCCIRMYNRLAYLPLDLRECLRS